MGLWRICLNTSLELLAPAKDFTAGIAALHAGADALYIGADRFGARSAAGNSMDDIQRLIAEAHPFGAKVYLTLNTLLKDGELQAARDMILEFDKIHGDGVIIQDPAILAMDLPSIPLIASTQMNIRNPETARFLQAAGFSRIILARELTLGEIQAIAGAVDIEVECFVHGSLCFAYSGCCTMSLAMGERSGNRGSCAQPCRENWELINSTGEVIHQGHLLSMKDLSLSHSLPALIDAGVRSFKIEGRLKDNLHVKNVVATYHRLLKKTLVDYPHLKRSSHGDIEDIDWSDPARTFHRQSGSFFFQGRGESQTDPITPKSRGRIIGKVKSAGKNWFCLEQAHSLATGDGLCFEHQGQISGAKIDHIDGERITLRQEATLTPGSRVYQNHDPAFLKKLDVCRDRYLPVSGRLQQAGIHLMAEFQVMDLVAREQCEFSTEIVHDLEPYENGVRRSWSKSGVSPFKVTHLQLSLDNPAFIPTRIHNDLRRKCLENLLEQLLQQHSLHRPERPMAKQNLEWLQKDSIPVLNQLAEKWLQACGAMTHIAQENTGVHHGQQVMDSRVCLLEEAGLCNTLQRIGLKTNYQLRHQSGRIFDLVFACLHQCGMQVLVHEEAE